MSICFIISYIRIDNILMKLYHIQDENAGPAAAVDKRL